MTMMTSVARTATKLSTTDARLSLSQPSLKSFQNGERRGSPLGCPGNCLTHQSRWSSRYSSGQPPILLQRRRYHSSQPRQQRTSQRSCTVKRRKATLASEAEAASIRTGPTEKVAQPLTFDVLRARIDQFLNKPRTLPIPRWVSPQHVTISLSECFGHSSFILVATSYAVDDFLHLRLIAIAGSTAQLVFTYFHPHGRVLWLPFRWNVLFILINSYRVLRVQTDRIFAEMLSPLMHHTYDVHFNVMDKGDFARLVRLGTIENFKKGELVVGQDEDNRYVRLLLRGTLYTEHDGTLTYQLHEGNFISEGGLHAGLLLRGNVMSCCDVYAKDDDVVILQWDRTELVHLFEVNKEIQGAIKAAISWDLVSKLKTQREMLAKGEIADPENWSKHLRQQTMDRYHAILRNMVKHPQYLTKRKVELLKYRDIHHVSDEQHAAALRSIGWTEEEFEVGTKEGQIDEDKLEKQLTGWRWYATDLYFRIFG